MPYNGSGVFTVINTFTPDTPILASETNQNNQDFAGGLTLALPRDGQAPMSGQFRSISGTVTAPGIAFSGDPDTGIRRVSSNTMAFVAGGVDQLTITATGIAFDQQLRVGDGTLAAPGLAFASATGTGLRRLPDGSVALTLGGVDKLTVSDTSALFSGALASFSGALSVGLSISAGGGVSGNGLSAFASGDAPNIAAIMGQRLTLEVTNAANNFASAVIGFHRVNSFGAYFGLDTDNQWKVGGWSMGQVAYKLWHEGNDGPGSGLNADLLDGLDSGFFRDASNLSVGTLAPARLPGASDLWTRMDGAQGAITMNTRAGDGLWLVLRQQVDGSNVQMVRFTNTSGGVTYGSISSSSGSNSVTYNTSSDYRLKTDVEDLGGSGEFIDALHPVEFTWSKSKHRTAGFIAHEFAEVSPESVSGEKDAVDEDGNPVYQAMQASSSQVMAHIVAEIQSLRRRVGTIESYLAI